MTVKLSSAVSTSITHLLSQTIGLDGMAIGLTPVKKAIEQRMAACGSASEAAYLQQLQTSPLELDTLIEMLVVPETWFFRDREPFVFLAHYLQSQWLPKHSHQVLRILSLPCATGEEPYSIAITLLEMGLKPTQFSIEAVDISHVALAKAQQGIYSQQSFRGDDRVLRGTRGMMTIKDFQARYFCPKQKGYQLREDVLRLVQFSHGNLLDQHLLKWQQYDVIFCRNLLIYLDRVARNKVIQRLEQWLDPEGRLFVGHSELGELPTSKFTALRHPLAFVVRKRTSQGQEKSPKVVTQTVNRDRLSSNRPPPKTTPPNHLSLDSLETARELANQGNLEEARKLCKAYSTLYPLDAEAYLLLGEIQHAMGEEDQAEQSFHKTLYLQPKHEEALLYLALLKEQRGDTISAMMIRQRIQRL